MFSCSYVQIQGAEPTRAGSDWWSLQPLAHPDLPDVKNSRWVRTPIDAFIAARLESKGLSPTVRAGPHALIRRVTFDLIGLPPTVAEVEAFEKETALDPQKAWEKLVDRLLASSHYGERWGRHWLDAVRFSESHGFEYDRLRDNAWRYRDYVIQAFNSDKPYAQFVQEQIAGDVLSSETTAGIVATGFLVAGPWDQAGNGAASATFRAMVREAELEDMLAAVGQTFLGLTVNCARCHDHKFDPVSTRDYYRMKAIFDGVYHGDRPLLTRDQVHERAVIQKKRQERLDEIRRKIAEIERRGRQGSNATQGPRESKNLPLPISRWTFNGDARDSIGNLHGTLKGGARIAGGRLVLNGKDAFLETAALDRDVTEKTLEAWLVLDNNQQRGGGVISLESDEGRVFDGIVFGERQPGKWLAGSELFHRTRDLTGPQETATPEQLIHVAVAYARDGRIALYRNGEPFGGSYVPDGDEGKPLTYKAREAHILIGKRHTGGNDPYLKGAIEEARLYNRALSAAQVKDSFKTGFERLSVQQVLSSLSDEDRKQHAQLTTELATVAREQTAAARVEMAYAANVRQPAPTFLLKRGDPDLKGERVTAGPPEAIHGPKTEMEMTVDTPESQRRLNFAQWLTHRDNPLFWRVMANRIWQHHFGEGIVRTPNDFGFNGDRPSDPLLLDWLADDFRKSGGSVKHLHRQILLSASYQQASTFNAASVKIDAENRLLWRYPARRLEAEALRDSMLAISGQLNMKAGGPSFRPFKLEVFNSSFYHLIDADTPDFNRRSVYRININSAKDPLLDVLDCPDPSVKTPKRSTTTTPLQALTMMNNSFVQRQARDFAKRVHMEAGDDAIAQVKLAYKLALARSPTNIEIERSAAVLKKQGLRVVCWALFNSSEFIYSP